MEHTVYIELEEHKAVVEQYIYDTKGVRIKIVFQNPMLYRRHFKMLCEAYVYAINHNKNR